MKVDEDLKKDIVAGVTSIIGTATALVAVAVAGKIADFIVTNTTRSNLAGDMSIHPTEDTVAISKVETAASEVEGKLAQDKVNAVAGDVKASELDAAAATAEATAADTGATALRTRGGASDIEVKVLKMT